MNDVIRLNLIGDSQAHLADKWIDNFSFKHFSPYVAWFRFQFSIFPNHGRKEQRNLSRPLLSYKITSCEKSLKRSWIIYFPIKIDSKLLLNWNSSSSVVVVVWIQSRPIFSMTCKNFQIFNPDSCRTRRGKHKRQEREGGRRIIEGVGAGEELKLIVIFVYSWTCCCIYWEFAHLTSLFLFSNEDFWYSSSSAIAFPICPALVALLCDMKNLSFCSPPPCAPLRFTKKHQNVISCEKEASCMLEIWIKSLCGACETRVKIIYENLSDLSCVGEGE